MLWRTWQLVESVAGDPIGDGDEARCRQVGIQSGAPLLYSAGLDLRIGLRSGMTAADSAWLEQVLDDHDRSGTSS